MAMLKWRRMFRSGATWRNRDMHNSTVGILHQRYDNCHRPKVYAGFSAKLQESGTRCQTTGSWITKGRRMPVREMGMWVVMLTRPDMAFCTVHLASCASAWTDEIYQALLNAARFLYDNSEYGFLKGSLLSYSSTAQKTVAMSPYRKSPSQISTDSMGARFIAPKEKCSKQSRHIGIRHFCGRELVMRGVAIFGHVPGADNISDSLTKALRRDKFIMYVQVVIFRPQRDNTRSAAEACTGNEDQPQPCKRQETWQRKSKAPANN